jgi:hypothetical protein
VAAVALSGALAGAARAEFPYALPPGGVPNDLQGKLEWMYAATPEANNLPVNLLPSELFGVRGAHLVDAANVDTAWKTTTGRPDVTIAVLDSGIKWNDANAMKDLRRKTRLSKAELPQPEHDRTAPLEALPGSLTCPQLASAYDANGDGVFTVSDYACDSRVEIDPAARAARGQPPGVGPADMLDPQDVLIPFSDGTDADGNGFKDDIVGWDFLDDDNDPYDDVQYGHGTGEARDSTAEANNAGELGTCPNCMSIHMRVGDSFIADESRFAQATIYAADNGALVIQEALGTLNHTELARRAVEYAYRHGVTVIASAADEAAQHHNWPSSNPHVIQVNSVTQYDETLTAVPRSYLQFNGCTNFSAKITVAIPSVSCSSDATGRGSGMAGLIYSAALDAIADGDLAAHPRCRRTNGAACPLSANEVRQLMASGAVGGTPMADDVNFATTELSCAPVPVDPCTDPNLNSGAFATRPVAPFPATFRYPARAGFDEFYGYGRVNMNRTVDAVDAGSVPPEAEITGPDWYSQVDPARPSLDVLGEVASRAGTYSCQLYLAPGSQPNNASDFKPISSGWCNGSARNGAFEGVLGTVDVAALKQSFPPSAGNFTGREPGTLGQSSNGRPNSEPYGFTVKLVATSGALRGEDRRNLFLHRDADMLPGFPRELDSDGESSPVFYDLDGDNRNELIFATADGDVHAMRPDGSELPGWLARGDPLPLHTGGAAFARGEVAPGASHGAFLASAAVGDLDRDGEPEVVAADFEGKLYAWDAEGQRVWTTRTNRNFSGAPLGPFEDVRKGVRNRTQQGFIGAPVLADIDGNDGKKLEVIAAAMDRHVYAWNDDGSPVAGFPVLVVDRSKVASVDPQTHAVAFNANAGKALNQGAIVDTPAVGDITVDGRPEIVVGTNEEYLVDAPGEGGLNAGGLDTGSLDELGSVAGLDLAHGRLYALSADGDPDGDLMSGPAPYLDGWPFKVARLAAELLPVVGEGITGAPVIGVVACPSGGNGPKIGTIPDAGIGYIVNADATSCYGRQDGKDVGLKIAPPAGPNQDTPALPAVGHPAFGEFAGGASLLSPAAGLRRALDLAVNEYQQGSQDFVAAWDAATGSFRNGFPAVVNDLQFLTGPSVADIDGQGGEEVVAGTASLDLVALGSVGQPVSGAWPKLTSDWMVANPLIGSFGVDEKEGGARKSVVALTRSGSVLAYRTSAPACSPGSWPRFHHDPANSGDARRDAVAPGAPEAVGLDGNRLEFRAPGDDLLCGKVRGYQAVTTARTPTGADFAGDEVQASSKAPGERAAATLRGRLRRYVAVRAVDDQSNVGRMAVIDRRTLLRIRTLRVKPRRFRAGRRATPRSARRKRARRGARIVMRISEAARVRFTIQRARPGRRRGKRCVAPKRARPGAKRCVRWKRRGTLRRKAAEGRNRYRFSGRIGKRALRPGRYRIRAVATDADRNRSRPRRAPFRIAPPV